MSDTSQSSKKDRPILFSGEMVRAIIEGRKTQTRRVIKPQAPEGAVDAGCLRSSGKDDGLWWWLNSIDLLDASPVGNEFRCPYGQPGDRLWVRESFNWADRDDLLPGEEFKFCPERAAYCAKNVVWKANGEKVHPVYGKASWKPSIHMPRWASRLTLELTEVRVERLQDISEEDAIAEGVDEISMADVPRQATMSRRADFAQLWNRINAKRGGGIYAREKNPWVWVLTFKAKGLQ